MSGLNPDTVLLELPMSDKLAGDLSNDGFLLAPWLAPFSLLFNNRFCRIWLADRWHIVMSRKGTCILSYPLPFFDGRKWQALRRGVLDCAGLEPIQETASSVRQNLRINRRSANISLLDPWQISTWFIHKWVLSYPDAFGVGKTRASPVDKRTTGMPSWLSPQDGILNGKARKNSSVQQLTCGLHLFSEKTLTLFICRYSRNAGQYS